MGDTGSETYECPTCSSEYTTEKQLMSHFTSDHSSDEQLAGVRNKKSDLYSVAPDVESPLCRVCSQDFDSMFVMMNHMSHKHTEEQQKSALCDEIDRLVEYFDHVPTSKEIRGLSTPSHKVYKRLFGSWANALEEAGYEPIRRRLCPNKNQLVNELQRLKQQLGKVPTQKDVQQYGTYSHNAYYKQFGSWDNALNTAGYESYRQRCGEQPRIYYGGNWKSKREHVTERDDHACRVCSKHSSEISHHAVNVHHITPAREFGAHDPDVDTDYEQMNDPSNLICLCPSCHAQLEGKFQDATPAEFAEQGREYLGIEDTTIEAEAEPVQITLRSASD